MDKPPFDAAAHMAAMAAALGLELKEEWKPGILDNLRRAHQIAQSFAAFPLPDEVEPASTFEAQ